MKKIKLLDDMTIQKIAAGEIIERPSSIVKELIENSLDANSDSIVVEIRNGGKDYIRITDNGDGISEDDLINAFKPHSTSKLSNIDDLYNIMSFGFRGEALASISSVAKVEVITKTDVGSSGIQAFVEEREIIKKAPIGCPKGTTMIVRDLFYNVPVREKFLKSNLVEGNHISDIVYKLALGNPGVSFKYIKDNTVILSTSKSNTIEENIYILLGKEFTNNLLEINCSNENFKIYGYISNNQFYRGNRNHQYLYINNRYIKNTNITKIIEERYKSLIPINRFPVFILFIDIDPSLIDVNIHPTKEEIKFVNEEELNTVLINIIDKSLRENLNIPKAFSKEETKDKIAEEIPLLYEKSFFQDEHDEIVVEQIEKEDIRKENTILEAIQVYDSDFVNYKEDYKKETKKEDDLKEILPRLKFIGVIFSTYILAEDTLSNKVFIIDQHAAHERILYEKYKKEYENEKVITQRLLKPEIVELTNLEFSVAMQNIDLLRRLGFFVEEFGNNSIIIREVPILFGNPQLKSLFLEIVDNIRLVSNNSYDYKVEKIMKIACTNAIKAGDKVANIEVISLFKQLSETENPYTCPHGRPTIIEITKEDMEKEFKRIM
ncbi:MAG: DNA mismatch repair endonuclease MutL [Tissierellia bacterium]|nr:DNA mismatch repair endonuclease MutL [Tissierellia bacterium]